MCWLFSLRCRNHDAHERLKNSTYSLTRGPKFSRIHWSGNALSSFFLSRRHSPKQGLPRNFLSANSDLNPFCWVHQTSFCEGGWITKWRVGGEEWKEEEEEEALVTGWKKSQLWNIWNITLKVSHLFMPKRDHWIKMIFAVFKGISNNMLHHFHYRFNLCFNACITPCITHNRLYLRVHAVDQGSNCSAINCSIPGIRATTISPGICNQFGFRLMGRKH